MNPEAKEANGKTTKPTKPTNRPILKPKPKVDDSVLNIPLPKKAG